MRRIIGQAGSGQDERARLIQRNRDNEKANINSKETYSVQSFSDTFIILNSNGIVKFISTMGEAFFGKRPEEMINNSIFEFCCTEDSQNMEKMFKRVIKDPSKATSKNISKKNESGEEGYFEIRMMNYLKEPTIEGIVISIRNITRRVQLEESLNYISTHDKTTGLANHVFFQSKINEISEIRRRERSNFALAIIDIDDFKYINNTFGYRCGDQLIIDIGKRLSSLIEDKGFLCRYLGDQFAIIIEEFVDMENCQNIGKEIIGLFKEPFMVDKYEVYVTASMGVGVFPDDGSDAFSLERNANKALFYAKSEGKNNYKFYSSGGDISSFKHFELRSDLHKAIERKQFICHFQPIVNIKNGTILAGEALLRWSHPT